MVKTPEDKKESKITLPKEVLLAMKTIDKKFAKGMLVQGAEGLEIEKLPTGIKEFDEALGGGFPRGMISELYGAESAGKSTVLLKTIAEAQKAGLICAYIDAEKAFDAVWAKKLGVNTEALLLSPVTDADNVFDILKELLRSEKIDLIIVDSVAALTPRAELEEEMFKKQMAALAKIVNKGLRVINTMNRRKGSAIVFINQLRSRVGLIFGNPDTTPGGRGMHHFAVIRASIKRGEWFPTRKDRIGFEIICRIEKNKTSMPYKEARFVFLNEEAKTISWTEANIIKKALATERKEEKKNDD